MILLIIQKKIKKRGHDRPLKQFIMCVVILIFYDSFLPFLQQTPPGYYFA